jgi:hypothetical protein
VATAEGLYLDKKLDLLAAYLLVGPANSALARLNAAVTALLARGKAADTDTAVQQQQQAAVRPPSKVSTASWRNMSLQPEPPAAAAAAAGGGGGGSVGQAEGEGGELRPFASADLAHQYARLVVRRSLRSQMPGPREVLAKMFMRLTLLVRGGGGLGGGLLGCMGMGLDASGRAWSCSSSR